MIYYISTTGNDSTGNGSQSSPWKTLSKAVSSVTTLGDTIHVNAGTYTETSTLNLAVGVNIEGDGMDTTIIKSSVSGDWSTFLNVESGSVTNGNQTISKITFDGQYTSESNYKTWTGIWVTFRSNVVLDTCKIQNFYDRGVIFNGNGDNRSTIPVDPKVYTTGNKVVNCIFTNTSRNSPNYIAGQLNIGGQKDMLISGNTMTQTQRVAGKNGELIKYWGSGYNLNCKIINNTLKKVNFTSNQYNGSNGDWNFAIELFNQSGLEIADNIIQGSIDLNYTRKGIYSYSTWIHNNILDHNPINNKEEAGIIFEFETDNAIVENNKFLNKAMGITFNIRTPNENGGYNNPKPVGGYSATTNNIIRNNLFYVYSNYSYGNCCGSVGIQFLTEGESKDGYVRNLRIENNTFVNRTSNPANSGIDLSHFTAANASTDGITINNNIFQGFLNQYLEGGSSRMLNTVTKDNLLWQNGNNNNPAWTGNLVNTGNIVANPNLDANFVSALPYGYKPSGVTPCTYTYSAWGACVNGTQTRTVISSTPSGCTGIPVLSQTCTGNSTPTVNAGTDKTLTLPVNVVTLSGTASDLDGIIVSYLWTKTSGPSGDTIATPDTNSTQVTNLVQGIYMYKLTVTDNSGASSSDEVTVTVNPVVTINQPPVVDAGVDETLTISKVISGSATDNGSIVSYRWTKVSGPTGLQIVTPTSNTTKLQNLKVGTYVLRLTATDNLGLKSFDDKTLIVIN